MSTAATGVDARPQNHGVYADLLYMLEGWAERYDGTPTEEEVGRRASRFAIAFSDENESVPDDVIQAAVSEILTRIRTTTEPGVAVVKKRSPWLEQLREQQEEWPYWTAYRHFLTRQGRERGLLQELERDVEGILDLAGDPRVDGTWQRRGLVMGDVQSGKTSNFIGLMNMAADAGYRLFIVISGHTDDLRVQTQTRVDEGFIGRRSLDANRRGFHTDPKCGVGERRKETVISVTTEESDFDARSGRGAHFGNLDRSVNDPLVLVVKKNAKILDNLKNWLESMAGSAGLRLPMMLIDDEADYASVNTNKKDKAESTAVNAAIRDLLACSQRASYVGFTATPFANVLIDDDAEDDLFPRDFIYSLGAPSSYMGARQFFDEAGREKYSRVDVQDAEGYFPFGHKRDFQVPGLPDSLKTAIETFVLACAISDLRGEKASARSMLVNVSRFNDVQEQVYRLIDSYVGEMSRVLEMADPDYVRTGHRLALARRLRETWEAEYMDAGHSWDQVAAQLTKSIVPIETELVNRTTSTDRARKAPRKGRRVIAVGGTILSRGLTLEGLTVSYFYQRTQLSDTLLQMGRWFGYRKGYEDLARVWLDHEVRSWFHFAASTLDEIRADIKLMQGMDATPKEFGVKIQRHPEALKVTAANKMRHGDTRTLSMSFAEQSLETKTADVDPSACETNRANLADLLQACEGQLSDASLPAERGDTGPHLSYAKIDRGAVEAFLSGFRPGPSDAHFSAPGDDGSLVAEYVRAEGHRHGDLWDVAVIAGKGQRAALPGVATSVPSNVRDTATAEEGRRRHLAFASRRLASERNLVDIAEKLQNGRTDRWALASGGDGVLKERVVPMVIDRPILMIYPISWSPDEVPAGWGRISPEDGVLGLKVTFPAVRDAHGQIIYAREAKTYVVNRVFLAEAGLLEELDGGDDE